MTTVEFFTHFKFALLNDQFYFFDCTTVILEKNFFHYSNIHHSLTQQHIMSDKRNRTQVVSYTETNDKEDNNEEYYEDVKEHLPTILGIFESKMDETVSSLGEQQMSYFVLAKDVSYCHCEWICEEDLFQRYNSTFVKRHVKKWRENKIEFRQRNTDYYDGFPFPSDWLIPHRVISVDRDQALVVWTNSPYVTTMDKDHGTVIGATWENSNLRIRLKDFFFGDENQRHVYDKIFTLQPLLQQHQEKTTQSLINEHKLLLVSEHDETNIDYSIEDVLDGTSMIDEYYRRNHVKDRKIQEKKILELSNNPTLSRLSNVLMVKFYPESEQDIQTGCDKIMEMLRVRQKTKQQYVDCRIMKHQVKAVNFLLRCWFCTVRGSTWKKIQLRPNRYRDPSRLISSDPENQLYPLNGILADDMGLGKTIECLIFLQHLRTKEHVIGPFLIVVPNSTIENWAKEIRKWTSMDVVMYQNSTPSLRLIEETEFFFNDGRPKCDIVLTTYSAITRQKIMNGKLPKTPLFNIQWSYLVMDEGHKIKNDNTHACQILMNMKADRRLILTGTPIQDNIEQLRAMLCLSNPKYPMFKQLYINSETVLSSTDIENLQQKLTPIFMRRNYHEANVVLPPKTDELIIADPTPLQNEYYKRLSENKDLISFLRQERYRMLKETNSESLSLSEMKNSDRKLSHFRLVNVYMQLLQVCTHPFILTEMYKQFFNPCAMTFGHLSLNSILSRSGKFQFLDTTLMQLKRDGHRVLLFTRYLLSMKLLERYCQLREFGYETMRGADGSRTRFAAVERFNNFRDYPDRFIFLLTTMTGGEGINLTGADTVILLDSSPNPQEDKQAIARAHRIGQTRPVKVYRIILNGNVETQLLERISKKIAFSTSMLPNLMSDKNVDNGFRVSQTGGVSLQFNGMELEDKVAIDDLLEKGVYDLSMENDDNIATTSEEDDDNSTTNKKRKKKNHLRDGVTIKRVKTQNNEEIQMDVDEVASTTSDESTDTEVDEKPIITITPRKRTYQVSTSPKRFSKTQLMKHQFSSVEQILTKINEITSNMKNMIVSRTCNPNVVKIDLHNDLNLIAESTFVMSDENVMTQWKQLLTIMKNDLSFDHRWAIHRFTQTLYNKFLIV